MKVFEIATGKTLLERTQDPGHDISAKLCEPCDTDLSYTPLTDITYTFEICSCGMPDYPHLFEQIWHRSCFAAQELNSEQPS